MNSPKQSDICVVQPGHDNSEIETKMTVKYLCEQYLAALNDGDLQAVRTLFTPDGVVVSPLYGACPAHNFYAILFADTERSKTDLLNIFEDQADRTAIAIHFNYVWTLASGKIATFECVDVCKLSDDRQRFRKITIIYDTANLRGDFEALQG